MTVWESVWQGIFHAVSAFCNAGFDNIGGDGLVPFQDNVPVNVTIMILIVAGGIGFTVWTEVGRLIKNPQKKSLGLRIAHLSLHSKIVFVFTGILIVAGAVLFLLLEWSNPETLGNLPVWQKVQAALFQSVTLRTAGFNTIAQSGLTEASQFCSCILMIIGGSSASAAGGMKTVTLGVIVFSMLSVLKGRGKLEAFGRTLPLDLLQKALTVASTMLIVVFVSTLLLHFTEQANPYPHTFLDLLFESCSATGTVGVSTGITPHLSPAGKIVVIICMYVGRLSPVTVVVALNTKLHTCADGVAFPQERVIIG
jgi:trk system potassium uptake protein TrkH